VAFAADFEMLARDTELRRRMGRQAREWVEKHGSVAAMAADYERLYTRINAPASREALV
jgi:hypothetical protein